MLEMQILNLKKGGNRLKKYKRMVVVIAALFVVVISAFPVFAAEEENHSDSISVINTVGLNNIHIAINQQDIVNGERVDIAINPTVLPAQVIDRICEIRNLANEAWIRTKVVFADDAPIVDERFLTISSEKWKKCGEYYYYTETVPNNKTIEFFNKINIPAEWDNSYIGKTISFNVFAEAVQSKNFTPDFESADPWFGTVIEHRVRDGYITPSEQGNQQFEVVYQNGAEGLVKVGDDFFSNWSTLMPGDVVKDKVLIKNDYALPTTIYFSSESIDKNKLIDKLKLRIYSENGEIYNGLLSGKVDEIVLAKLKKGEELEVFYELTVPSELTNEFSLMNTKTKWIFRVEADNMVPPTPDATGYVGPDNPNYTPDSPDYDGWSGYNGASSVQTGDVSLILSVAIAIAICFAAFFVIVVKGGKKREEN